MFKGGMKLKIMASARGWLKGFHILFSVLWTGAAVCMMLLSFVNGHITNGDELWAVNRSLKLIDDYIIIASANGCIITGILFSTTTNWGFFRHKWITVKYIIMFAAALLGTFVLGPAINGMEAISDQDRFTALQNLKYIRHALITTYIGSFQTVAAIFMLFISVLKPWGKKATQNTSTKKVC